MVARIQALWSRPARRGSAAGFTLVETLIALVLSSFVLVMVSHTFLVQNRFYATQRHRTGAQDNVRAGTELVAREVRTTLEGGVLVAGPRTLTVRSPLAVTAVCNRQGVPNLDVFNEGGEAGLALDEFAGVAARDPVTGALEAANVPWSDVNGNAPGTAGNCADNGADTTGVTSSFHRLRGFNSHLSFTPDEGDVVVLFRETTFALAPSALDPSTYGLFRAAYGDSLAEFATGIDTTARFQYRTTAGTYVDTVTAAALGTVDAVRVVARARKPAATGGTDDITFGWSVNIPIRGIR